MYNNISICLQLNNNISIINIYEKQLKNFFNNKYKNEITELSIYGNINNIQDGLFQDYLFTNVYLDDNIKNIGSFCFNNCRNLKTIHIPQSITTIQNSTFENCINLLSINFSSSLTSLHNNAFDGCSNLISVNLQNVKYIGNSCFSACKSLRNIITSNNIKYIGYQSFQNCINLSNINIYNAILDLNAFEDCIHLKCYNKEINIIDKQISIKKNILNDNRLKFIKNQYHLDITNTCEIDYAMFEHNYEISSITIDDNVEIINDYAFHRCVNLKKIKLPKKLKYIGKYAFSSCYQLENFILPANINIIDKCAFAKCFNIKNIIFPYKLKYIKLSAFEYCYNLKNIQFNGRTLLYENVFNNCHNLKQITMYNNIYILKNSFIFCFNLTNILQLNNSKCIMLSNSISNYKKQLNKYNKLLLNSEKQILDLYEK